SKEFSSVAKILMSQLDEFPQKRDDKDFLGLLNVNIIRFTKIRKEMNEIAIQDTEKKIVSQKDRDMDKEIYANIIRTAQIRNVPIPKIDS
ncbi:MAG: hypothetical protein Q8K26_02335, partial [Candidatus Gracilibacteria bacterium]|nr:hypothetical protein [Candidatus Gracilibacteria bacterium]